ncbi:MAG TPA: DUF1549 and DUF1553 domain-containing protein [Gemmataceae bacterium]|nr:DUF1549 and DUF1553 domain-containing protein [Gemmataceae bacterium]
MAVRLPLALIVSAILLLLNPTVRGEPGETEKIHWSFQKHGRPAIPAFQEPARRAWVRNAVDAFVLDRLDREGLRPAAEADRRTLIRRVCFDLTGLPPTPEQIADFVASIDPLAYEKLVDRLLASPHYGERWGRHWLDVVRFAETEGFEYDRHRPGAWRYRDYVIRSFNDDKPYDRFVREQLAGDEIAPDQADMEVAVGFYRLGPIRRNAGNPKVAFSRNEALTEMTDSIGAVFLGLTVGCARCHDHKFDDFSQTDYYRLQAFLAQTQEHTIVLADARTKADWESRTRKVQAEVKRIKQALETADGEERMRMRAKLATMQRQMPPPLPAISSVHDEPGERTAIHVLKRGDPDRKGKPVGMRVPSALLKTKTPELPADTKNPRSLLAAWINDPDNPLAARVLVNRVWQYHFGRGIVATPNDFGVNGSAPSHPELLDYLANEFLANGRRLKPLHRLILLSSTYRQASRSLDGTQSRRKDPDNRLLWHAPRRRLDAEEVRDAMLALAGKLNLKAGGPSVVVPVDKDLVDLLYDPSQWTVTADAAEHNRRSVYLLAKRNLRLPFMEVFDQPDAATSCPRRAASTHALQALELLNGSMTQRLAEAFAQRLEREAGTDATRQVERAYLLAAGRAPTPREKELAVKFLARQPLREFALAVFSLNAFLYVD